MNYIDMVEKMPEDVYIKLQEAVAIGKWENGEKLSKEQQEICMQTLILYDQFHKKEEDRIAYVPPKEKPCNNKKEADLIKFMNKAH